VIVEQRDYRTYVGKLNELVGLYEREGIALQQRYLGHLVGAFTTDVGPLPMYTHLWAYDDYEERRRRRAELQADETWVAFLAKIQPLIHTQENRILIPTSFSPLR
jgi:NIPSNAP